VGGFDDHGEGCNCHGGGEGVGCVPEEVGGERVVGARLVLRWGSELTGKCLWVASHQV